MADQEKIGRPWSDDELDAIIADYFAMLRGAGYDVLSFEPDGRERLIEVKTTNGAAKTPFFLTRNESGVAAARADTWRLYRVHLFSQTPRIFTIKPPLDEVLHLRPEAWRASFR